MRLFMAIDLDPNIRRAVEKIQRQIEEPGLNVVRPENLHLTLKFLGEMEDVKVEGIIKQLEEVKMQPFEVEYSGIGAFPSLDYIRVIWIGINGEGLQELAGKVRNALSEYPDDHPFSAHLTIARVKHRPQRLGDNLQKLADVKIGKQLVSEFKLKKSTLTPQGPVYEDVKVFKLGADES
ncbi:MAG: RNA 2',3'-cyclic phosphodiesterase [Candidatus Aenigmarchaeota archaeon]|nr:RNA 2',3'-cyclic phosphodiesterase [Candidatus Aenigmarchaeota archaeon]